jgi:hypothetical protein
MNKIKTFVEWIFKITYQDSTITHGNIADNSIFFISFIFTNIIGFIVNSFVYTLNLNRLNPYFFLAIYVVVFIISRFYFIRDENIKNIKKVKPSKSEVIKLNFIFFFSILLFFSSLAIVYAELN